jgi:hypothetical protein
MDLEILIYNGFRNKNSSFLIIKIFKYYIYLSIKII